jgi:hypothetical protein
LTASGRRISGGPVARRPGTIGSWSICRASAWTPGWITSWTRLATAAGSSLWSGARRPEYGNCRMRDYSTRKPARRGQLAYPWQREHPGRIGRPGPADHGDERQGRATRGLRNRSHAAGRRPTLRRPRSQRGQSPAGEPAHGRPSGAAGQRGPAPGARSSSNGPAPTPCALSTPGTGGSCGCAG